MRLDRTPWTVPSRHPRLPSGVVHVWATSLRASPSRLAALASLLSADEQARAAAFRVVLHRQRFVVARGVLRSLLGRYLDMDPGKLRFRFGAFGRPEVCPPRAGFSFSVSHCEETALIAVGWSGPVGVDLERVDPSIDVRTLAADYLAREERAELYAAPPSERPLRFTRCWTRKEAYVKSLGVGLSFPLRDFAVVPLTGSPGRLGVRPDRVGERPVHVIDLIARREAAAALAYPADCVEARRWRWDEGEGEAACRDHGPTGGRANGAVIDARGRGAAPASP